MNPHLPVRGGSAPALNFDALEATLDVVQREDEEIIRPIFPFSGERGFHFTGHSGNEPAVWSQQ